MLIKKIAIISSSAGALVNFRGPLIAELDRRGFAVGAFAPDFTPVLRTAVASIGAEPIDYRLERTGTSFGSDLASLWDLVGRLRCFAPDLALSHFMKPVIYGTTAAAIARVPRRYAMIEGLGYAFTDTGERSLKRLAIRRVMQMMLRGALRQAQGVIFLNEDDRAELVAAGIAPAHRSGVLGGIGLPLSDFPFAPPPEGPPVFLMIGRLIREKGAYEFVEAARLMRASQPDARFVLLGGVDPKPGALSAAQVQAWVNEGLIEWPGEVRDVRPWLRACTTFVLPSYREGLPRSTQEAMAIGRAIVTTDVPGCRSTVVEGRNGHVVPVRDPHALAEAMTAIVRDPAIAVGMGHESRRLAEERYDVDRVNQRLIEMIGIAP